MPNLSEACGTVQGACQPKRVLQCEEQMISISSNLDRLSGFVMEIENRLARVVRQEPAKCAKDPSSPKECLVDFADSIRNQSERIAELGDRLSYLLTHLEI